MIPTLNLPKHIAIVMDGNGRWAKKRHLPRIAGHKAGIESTRSIVKYCAEKNIAVLSLFAFSSENWHRPPSEVSYLMQLFLMSLEREVAMLNEQNVQLRFIGDRARFNDKLSKKIVEVENMTATNTGLVLIIAVDYGGQWDILHAMQCIARDVEADKLKSADVTRELIASKLSFADLPNPDLFIRTSGELRISNFMLWQLAYAELYFTDTLWPDFGREALEEALKDYTMRERRYGTADSEKHMNI